MHERRRHEVARTTVILLLTAFILAGFVSISQAQTYTGSINGKILDEEGKPLTEASVYLTSPSMLGIRIYITSMTGHIVFPGLPAGLYTIRAEKPEYETVIIERIIVRIGKSVNLDITLGSTSSEEETMREFSTPALDLTTAKTASSIEKDILMHIPFPRNLEDIIDSMPGVVTEQVPFQKRSFILGQTEKTNTFALDGISINDPSDRFPLIDTNFDIIDEIELITAAHSSEIGSTSGGHINVIPKAGGNEMDGDLILYHTSDALSSYLRSEDVLDDPRTSPPTLDKRLYDASLSFGGLIFEDILWFFGNARSISQKQTTPFIPWTDPLGTRHQAFNRSHEEKMAFFKLSGHFLPELRITGLFNYSDRYRSVYGPSVDWNTPEESTRNLEHSLDFTAAGNISYIINQNTIAYAKAGYLLQKRPMRLDDLGRTQPHYLDEGTGRIWGSGGFNENRKHKRFQAMAFITHFKDRFLGGRHALKAGAEYDYASRENAVWKLDNMSVHYVYGTLDYFGQDVSPDSGLLVNKGKLSFSMPGVIETDSNPVNTRRRYSLFFEDSATYWGRLSIILGLRYDWSETELESFSKVLCGNSVAYSIGENVILPVYGFNPFDGFAAAAWKDIIVWHTLSPRIGMSFDILGNGKSLLKASFARYPETLFLDYLTDLNPINAFRSHQFYWFDEDMDGEVEESDTYVPFSDDYRLYDTNYYRTRVDPKTKAPYTDEYTLGFYQELFPDFSIHVNYIHKEEKNKLAAVLYEPDQDRYWYTIEQDTDNWWIPFETIVPGTDIYPDAHFTLYFRSNDAPLLFNRMKNVSELERKYQALEIAFKKRMSNSWQLNGSLVFSRATGNTWSYYGAGSDFLQPTLSPNYFVNLPLDSRVEYDVPLSFKLMGTYKAPFGIFLSFYFRYMKGIPIVRSVTIIPPSSWVQANNADPAPVTVLLESPGERRTGPFQSLDLRIEKRFRVGKGGSLNLSADIMNVFGRRYDFTLQNDGGFWYPDGENTDQGTRLLSSTYQNLTLLSGIRTVRLSLRFNF